MVYYHPSVIASSAVTLAALALGERWDAVLANAVTTAIVTLGAIILRKVQRVDCPDCARRKTRKPRKKTEHVLG